jgi:hypothetical protein
MVRRLFNVAASTTIIIWHTSNGFYLNLYVVNCEGLGHPFEQPHETKGSLSRAENEQPKAGYAPFHKGLSNSRSVDSEYEEASLQVMVIS